MKYTVIAHFEGAVNLEVEATSEDEALKKADEMIVCGEIPDAAILSSCEFGEVYVMA